MPSSCFSSGCIQRKLVALKRLASLSLSLPTHSSYSLAISLFQRVVGTTFSDPTWSSLCSLASLRSSPTIATNRPASLLSSPSFSPSWAWSPASAPFSWRPTISSTSSSTSSPCSSTVWSFSSSHSTGITSRPRRSKTSEAQRLSTARERPLQRVVQRAHQSRSREKRSSESDGVLISIKSFLHIF